MHTILKVKIWRNDADVDKDLSAIAASADVVCMQAALCLQLIQRGALSKYSIYCLLMCGDCVLMIW